jgi:translation initiation factor 2A
MPPGAPGYGQYANGESNYGKRHVPGASAPGGDNEKRGNKKKKGDKNKNVSAAGEDSAVDGARANGNANGTPKGKKGGQQPQQTPPPPPPPEVVEPPSPVTPASDGALDAVAKRIRNLNKKVR